MKLAARSRAAAIAAGLLLAPAARARARVAPGQPVESQEMKALDGTRHPLLEKDRVNVLVFFRAGQDRSLETVERMAECEKLLAGRSVAMAGIVPGSAPREEVRAMVLTSGLTSPVLVDEDDALYGKWELRQHPVIVLVDQGWRVHSVEPYVRLRHCEIVKAKVLFLLGEIDRAAVDQVVHPPRAAFPNEVGGGPAARFVRLGDRQRAKGSCALAVRSYDEALRRDPRNAAALEGRRRCGVTAPPPPAPAEKR